MATDAPLSRGALRAAIEAVSRAAFGGAATPGAVEALGVIRPQGMALPATAVVHRLLEAAELSGQGRVLVIGAGSGYLVAIVARLASEVHAVERLASLAGRAEANLRAAGCTSARLRVGEGEEGWPDAAPFDAILVTTALDDVPAQLVAQLAPGGRLVVPVGPRESRQTLVRVTLTDASRPRQETLGTIRLAPRLGDVLVEWGMLDRATIDAVLPTARVTGRRLGEALVAGGHLDEPDVFRALAAQAGLRLASVDAILARFDADVVQRVPRAFLEHHRVVPFARRDDVVLVATADPASDTSDLRRAMDAARVERFLITPTDYQRIWRAIDTGQVHRGSRPPEARASAPSGDDLDLLAPDATTEADAVSLFESLLIEAIAERASDIHLERYGEVVRVRLRVDGDLRDLSRYRLTVEELLGVVNVLKVSARLDIAERRLPQGGRFRRRAGGQAYDLRVQTQPSLHGEHAIIRLLPQDAKPLAIVDLGFPERVAREYRRLLDGPSGLVLVGGPTGSGKSTTLYAGLQVLARDATRKVITVEDPVEYSIDSVQQTQIRPELGFGFADAMRVFVREDPDVIVLGEIRDGETALEAIRASQTGHLVLSTLHCNDAVDAIQRLRDLGMYPNSIASELSAVVTQRLAKRICPACRAETSPDPEIVHELFPDGAPDDFRAFRGAGCAHCGGYGTRGRVAVLEFLRAGPKVRDEITQQAPLDRIRKTALDEGLLTMRACALEHVKNGVIPLGELRSILPLERMAP